MKKRWVEVGLGGKDYFCFQIFQSCMRNSSVLLVKYSRKSGKSLGNNSFPFVLRLSSQEVRFGIMKTINKKLRLR